MSNYVWKQCGSKRRYRDAHMANTFMRKYENERGKKLDYYWCRYCKGFHLTSMELDLKYTDVSEDDQLLAVGF